MTNNRIYGWDQQGNELADETFTSTSSPTSSGTGSTSWCGYRQAAFAVTRPAESLFDGCPDSDPEHRVPLPNLGGAIPCPQPLSPYGVAFLNNVSGCISRYA